MMTAIIAALISGGGAIGAWLVERFLGRWLSSASSFEASSAQQAVATEQKMAQDMANVPDQDAAVKSLENGNA